MSEMIERVAQAAHKAAYDSRGSRDITLGPDWMAVARAAIAAMREPSNEMMKAGYASSDLRKPDMGFSDAWRNMIDAALQE